MKRSPLKRTLFKRKPVRREKFPDDLKERVLKRDGRCFASTVDPEHTCRDQWGNPHRPDELSKLTVDHVNAEPGGTRGKRAPDREENLVAMCAFGNVPSGGESGPTRLMRQREREYLRELYAA